MLEDPNGEWLGAVCELVTDSSSKTYTFGEWPLVFNREYKASAQLFEWDGYIGDPVETTFTVSGATLFKPHFVASPTNLTVSHISGQRVAVQWDSVYDANGWADGALKLEGWQVCWDESCGDLSDRSSDGQRFAHYENPTISSGGKVTVRGVGTYNGVRVLSEPLSWTAPTVAPPTNLRIATSNETSMVIQWENSYSEDGNALRPEKWWVCLGRYCEDLAARPGNNYPFAILTRPALSTTATVQSMATHSGALVMSEPVSIVIQGK